MGCRVTLPLIHKSEREAESLVDGHRVSVAIGGQEVIVDGVAATETADAELEARSAAAKFLDLLCSLHDHCLALGSEPPSSGRQDRPMWALVEPDIGPATYSIHDSSDMCTEVTFASADASGGSVDGRKLGAVSYVHFPAMASYRSAMRTENTFQKFRDFYLAIENASARLHPGHGGNGALLEKAISTVYGSGLPALCSLAANAGISCQPATAVTEVKQFLWNTHRLPLFHAARNARVVSDASDEADVERALPFVKAVARDLIHAAAAKP
jgi:hypothetical protein